MKNKFGIDICSSSAADKNISSSFKSKYLNTHFEKLQNVEKELSRLPEKEEFFFLQSEASFNAFTFIPAVIKHYKVKELHAATYSISRRVINALIELHDQGYIDKITLLISDSLIKRNPVTIDLLCSLVTTRPNIVVYFAWSHAKIATLKTKEHHFVIEGSGNWSENAHYEQYLFSNSKQHYEFRQEIFKNSTIRHIADGRGLRVY